MRYFPFYFPTLLINKLILFFDIKLMNSINLTYSQRWAGPRSFFEDRLWNTVEKTGLYEKTIGLFIKQNRGPGLRLFFSDFHPVNGPRSFFIKKNSELYVCIKKVFHVSEKAHMYLNFIYVRKWKKTCPLNNWCMHTQLYHAYINPFMPTVPIFAVRETASLGIMGAPRVPPLNPSETIEFWEHYRLWGV